LAAVCGEERLACVGREISKKFEELKTATLSELKQHFSQKEVKGEIVLVVSGIPPTKHAK
jgi:16S rRNA (cytidine1402-2'-O)-methyltransferase